MKSNKIFIVVIAVLFIGLTIVFSTFPRSKFSELEKRELATFPEFTLDKLKSGEFARQISAWFSDSEPFRDEFMTLSMEIQDRLALRPNAEDNITFHASGDGGPAAMKAAAGADAEGEMNEFHNADAVNDKAKMATKGIMVTGVPPTARALNIYGGNKGGELFAEACNTYGKEFGPDVKVYCMVIPGSTEFYIPEKVRHLSNSMFATIRNVYEHLDPSVRPVDVYTPLSKHVKEDIFLRTDHHWAPLGAYYAAQAYAKVAGVPFMDLSKYDRHVVHDFVGSMYGYSKDIAIKKSPEDFVYWTPRDVSYTTTYIDYKLNDKHQIVHVSEPVKGKFFMKYPDGHSGAYSTFMGSDKRLTKIETGTKNGRRLILIKDSFGNALPGYLFGSFEEIHVIDNRYFDRNMRDYVRNNRITDILIASNVFRVYPTNVAKGIINMLSFKNR